MKKVISLLLSVAMVATVFAGCGDDKEETKASADTFYIGAIGPVTGGAAVYGQSVKNGAQLAVDEINAAGGINGQKIEFKFEDDEAVAEKAVNAYNSLKDWGMQALIGTVTTGACLAVVDLTEEDNMFQLTPSASALDVIEGDNVFQVCFTDPNQGIASADYIADNKVASKIGVIYDSSDAYSSGIYAKFKTEASAKGLEIVAAEAFTSESKSDFSVQVQACKDAGAELVFLPIYYAEAALILTQADSIGYEPIFFGCDGLDGILTVENFDLKLAEEVMLLTPFAADGTDDKTVKFVKAYKEKYSDTPTQFAADAYDAVYIIKAAIEKAGVKADASISDICEDLKSAITEISVDGLTGDGMTWKSTGEVNKAPMAVKIKDGAYVSIQ